MKLVASMIFRNELGRYLEPCLRHLLTFVDEIRILDDASDDGWADVIGQRLTGDENDRIHVLRSEESIFYAHEGRARQALLDWTLQGRPTHVLAIDADEFVTDGLALRYAIDTDGATGAWSLCMQEVWGADTDGLDLRMDNQWVERDCPILWAVGRVRTPLRLPDKALASGRTPVTVGQARRGHSCSAILHLGWANVAERAARYQRYVVHDGGRFHRDAHLESIMWPDDRVKILRRDWPEALAPVKDMIVAHAGVKPC